jgi:hypothetical protein
MPLVGYLHYAIISTALSLHTISHNMREAYKVKQRLASVYLSALLSKRRRDWTLDADIIPQKIDDGTCDVDIIHVANLVASPCCR